MDVGSWCRVSDSVASLVSPWKGRWPVTNSYRSTPNEKMSEHASTLAVCPGSGDMYATVPTIWPASARGCGAALSVVPSSSKAGVSIIVATPKVQDFCHAIAANDDVSRLEVTVHDSVLMCLCEPIDNLDRIPKHFGQWQRAAPKAFSQALPIQVLHHEEVNTALVPNVVENANGGMTELGHNARLALESLLALGIAGQTLTKDLESYDAIQTDVASFVDHSHAARPNDRHDLVRAKLRSRSECHGLSSDHRPVRTSSHGRLQPRDVLHNLDPNGRS